MIKNYYIFVLTFALIFLNSCSKNLVYINDINLDTLQTTYIPYRVQSGDYLSIEIKTLNKDLNEIFQEYVNYSPRGYNYGPVTRNYIYLYGYRVDDSGYIDIPLVGKFYVEDKTVEEIKNLIKQTLDTMITNYKLDVRIVNNQIYFIGEVNTSISLYKEKMNIFEAISQIGGLPPSADKQNIYIFRRTPDGYITFKINLTTKNIFNNQNFYLKPNDIIYVPPRKMQLARLQYSDISFIISVLTTTASVISLIIALTKP